MIDTDKSETLQGVYTGTGPEESRLDPLTLVCELASSVSNGILEGWIDNDLIHETNELHHLRTARKLLMLNARHVPKVVDDAIEHAEALRPKAS